MLKESTQCIMFMCLFGIWAEVVTNEYIKIAGGILSSAFAVIGICFYILEIIKERSCK
jgi:hypothetical protein